MVVIRDEINAEHTRETALLTASAHSTKQEQMVVWQQRFASVDRIARTLEGRQIDRQTDRLTGRQTDRQTVY